MKKKYATLLLALFCTISVFSSQLYRVQFADTISCNKILSQPAKATSAPGSIVSGMITLPSIFY